MSYSPFDDPPEYHESIARCQTPDYHYPPEPMQLDIVTEDEQPTHALQRLDPTARGSGKKWPIVALLRIPKEMDGREVAAQLVALGLCKAREIQRQKVRLDSFARLSAIQAEKLALLA